MRNFAISKDQMRMAIKTTMLSVVLVLAVGCLSDEEWDKVGVAVARFDDVRLPPLPPFKMARLTLSIDSADQKDSVMTVWIHARYDSTMVLSGLGLRYWESSDVQTIKEIFDGRADTIDFRSLENSRYPYQFQVDSLKSGTMYQFCAFLDHVIKGDTVRVWGSMYNTGCKLLQPG